MPNFTRFLCGVALAALVTVPAAADEGTFVADFGALAVGKITTLSPTHLFWTGAFSGVALDPEKGPFHLANVTCPSSNDLDFQAGTSVIQGYCLITDGADSAIISTFTCTGVPGKCEGTATWKDGRGKWEGWTADVTFTGELGAPLEDGSVPTHAVWTVSYKTP